MVRELGVMGGFSLGFFDLVQGIFGRLHKGKNKIKSDHPLPMIILNYA